MKNRLYLIVLGLVLICLTACGKSVVNTGGKSEDNSKVISSDDKSGTEPKKIIYTTFIPVTDLTKRIVGDKWEVRSIMGDGDEPHSFELKTKDMARLTDADLIVYNGANMEGFIPDLKNVIGDENKFLDLSQGLTLLEAKESENHDFVNPHTWLSVKNAIEQLDTVYKKISAMDPENEPYYKKNLEENRAEFKKLDKKFESELAKVKGDKYFVISHAAFNYLASDYGLKQVAVAGISPEEEPTAKQLKAIADFVKAHNISTIFFEGKATPKVAETLAKNTSVKTSTMYTMENLTPEEAKLGYIKIMEKNLDALLESFK